LLVRRTLWAHHRVQDINIGHILGSTGRPARSYDALRCLRQVGEELSQALHTMC
jgi:hypothetical protein